MSTMGTPERKQRYKGTDKIGEVIFIDQRISTTDLGTSEYSNQNESHTHTPSNITFKLWNKKDRKKTLKEARGERETFVY